MILRGSDDAAEHRDPLGARRDSRAMEVTAERQRNRCEATEDTTGQREFLRSRGDTAERAPLLFAVD